MSPYFSLSRRQIIRSTWQKLYENSSTTDFRFVISNPDPTWEDVLAQENATYGDLIALRHLQEISEVANSIKTVEFFKYLTLSGQERRWTFVTKLDDNSYLDSRQFYLEWLEPIINNSTNELVQGIPEVKGIVIGKGLTTHGKNFIYPSGQFYTMSWDMARIMAEQQRIHNVTTFVDVLVGELLQRGQTEYKFVELPYAEAFEIAWDGTEKIDGKATAWAEDGTELNAWFHPVGPSSINPHRMKEDDQYLMVTACYDLNGSRRPGTGPPVPKAK
jgi:beta-1,3-galactosyltransferase 1